MSAFLCWAGLGRLQLSVNAAFVTVTNNRGAVGSAQPFASLSTFTISQTSRTSSAIPRQTTELSAQKKNNMDDVSTDKRTTTKIEDGSPLGVAIVGLGALVTTQLKSRGVEIPEGTQFLILIMASTAAGISRLVRAARNKED